MKRAVIARGIVVLGLALTVAVALARGQNTQSPTDQNNNDQENDRNNNKPPPTPLPSDERLLALHLKFVKDAEKLAAEYEGKKQLDKAAVVYEEILKLVPAYPKAKQGLDKIRQQEALSNTKTVSIDGGESWQDTGVRVIAGKPLTMIAKGSWTVKLSQEVGPDGIDLSNMPKGLKLGSLVGLIANPGDDMKKLKPFYIGSGTQFIAERLGSLLVCMFDLDNRDNSGHVTLQVVGRFDAK